MPRLVDSECVLGHINVAPFRRNWLPASDILENRSRLGPAALPNGDFRVEWARLRPAALPNGDFHSKLERVEPAALPNRDFRGERARSRSVALPNGGAVHKQMQEDEKLFA